MNGGRLALNGGIRRDNDLVNAAVIYAFQQRRNPQLLRSNAVQRRDGPMQHMVDTIVRARLFNGRDVRRLLHHTNEALVAGCAGAVSAWVNVSDVATYRTKMKCFFKSMNRCRQCFGVFRAGAKDVKCHPLRALTANARKLFQFIDESSHGLGKLGHEYPYIPGSPRPPSIPPTLACMAWSTFRPASFTAAVTRSCSISTSPDFTASGSILVSKTCFCPFILTVTAPPPDVASTTVCFSFSCSASACFCACCNMSCNWRASKPPIACS